MLRFRILISQDKNFASRSSRRETNPAGYRTGFLIRQARASARACPYEGILTKWTLKFYNTTNKSSLTDQRKDPMKKVVLAGILMSTALAGCNGALNGAFRLGPPPSAPSATSPTPSATPTTLIQNAIASGTVEDYDTATPVANVAISIAQMGMTTKPAQITTTDSAGKFTFKSLPGTYLIVVGDDSATGPETTYHGRINLVVGQNNIGQATPSNGNPRILTQSETDGNFRIGKLNTQELSCLQAINAQRTTRLLTPVTPDESGYELLRYYAQLQSVFDVENPMTDATITNFGLLNAHDPTTHAGDVSAISYAGIYSFMPTSPPYTYVTNAKTTWYAAEFTTGGTQTYGVQVELASP